MDIGTIVKIVWCAVGIFIGICFIQNLIYTIIDEYKIRKAKKQLMGAILKKYEENKEKDQKEE